MITPPLVDWAKGRGRDQERENVGKIPTLQDPPMWEHPCHKKFNVYFVFQGLMSIFGFHKNVNISGGIYD